MPLNIEDPNTPQLELAPLGEDNTPPAPIDQVKESLPIEDVQPTKNYSADEQMLTNTALYGALAKEGGNTVDNYYKIKDSISYGSLTELNSIRHDLSNKLINDYKSVMSDTQARGDGAALANQIIGFKQIEQELAAGKVDVKKHALENTAISTIDGSETLSEQERIKNYLGNLNERGKVRQAVNQTFDHWVGQSNTGVKGFAVDMLDTMIPGQQVALGRVARDILGEQYNVMAGDMYRDLGYWIRNHKPEEQQAAAEQVLSKIAKYSGISVDNDVMKVFTMEAVRAYALGEDPAESDRILNNALGFVELAGILPARFIAKMLGKLQGPARLAEHSPLGEFTHANPKVGVQLQAGALQDTTGKTAAELGTTGEEIAKSAMPQPLFDDLHTSGTPSDIVDALKELQGKSKEAVRIPDNLYYFSNKDFENHINKVGKILRKEEDTFAYHPDKMQIGVKEGTDTIQYRAVYGKDSTTGFDSLAEAKKAMDIFNLKEKKALPYGNFKILIHDAKTGIMEEYNPKLHQKMLPLNADANTVKKEISKLNYQAQAYREKAKSLGKVGNKDREINMQKAEELELAAYRLEKRLNYEGAGQFYVQFSGESKMPYSSVVGIKEEGIKALTPSGRWLFDSHSIFDPEILNPYIQVNEKRFLIKHDLFELSKPFQELPLNSKKRVADLLKQADETGEGYKLHDLLSQGYSHDEVVGYASARTFWDAVYEIKNNGLRNDLIRDGWKGIKVLDDKGNAVYENGIQLKTRTMQMPKKAFDPVEGKVVELTEGELDNIYNSGGSVGKALTSVDMGDNAYTHIIIRNPKYITGLPKEVLYKRPNYIFRLNTDPYYIVEKTDRYVDGVLDKGHRRVLGSASNRVQALAHREKLIEEEVSRLVDEGTPVSKARIAAEERYPEPKLDRNIAVAEDALKGDSKLLNSDIGFWYNRRGERLKRLDGTPSRIEDPLKSMERVSNSLSSVIAQRDLLETELARHRATFPQFYGAEGRYIGHELKAQEATNASLRRANTWWDYIESIRTTPTAMDKMWINLMVGLDHQISKTGLQGLSKASAEVLLKRLSKVPPGRMATGATFSLTLGLKPIRQLTLQGMSGLHMMGLSPGLTAKSFGEATAMSIGMGFPDAGRFIAKGLGYSPKEWDTIMHQFRMTGKQYSIDANLYINEVNFKWTHRIAESKAGAIAHTTANALKTPFTIGKAIGFDAGEVYNQMVSWNFARNLWVKNHPGADWTSKEALLEIAGASRHYSFDMTKTATLPYQRGALASATQFMAINHKATLNLLPDLLGGSKRLKDVRGQYVLGVMAMYGLAGTSGLDDAYDSLVEQAGLNIPPAMSDAIKGGILENMLNVSLDLAMGDKVGTNKMAWSNSYSPFSGAFTFAYDAGKAIVTGDDSTLQVLTGPSYNTLVNLKDAASEVRRMWAMGEDDTTWDRVVDSVDRFKDKFGMFSDIAKYSISLGLAKQTGKLMTVSKSGAPLTEATKGELLAKLFTATQTKSEVELWREIIKNSGSRDTMEADAKAMAKEFVHIFATEPDVPTAFKKMGDISMALYQGNPSYALQVIRLAKDKYFHITPQSDRVVKKWLEYHGLFNPDATDRGVISQLNASPLFKTDEERARAIEFYKSLSENIKSTNKFLTNEGQQ